MTRPLPLALLCLAGCAAPVVRGTLPVDRVVLHQNGVGYVERRGPHAGGSLELGLAPHEVDDALETLTVLTAAGESAAATVTLPERRCAGDDCRVAVRMQAPATDELAVAYAVPVPSWRPAYRVVTDGDSTRLQVWALIRNGSREAWRGVTLELATAAPFHFATGTSALEQRGPTDARRFFQGGATLGIVTGGRSHRNYEGPNDLCPDAPEDFDGFEDEDGCPDVDNDHDRILDVDDQCPEDPETYNGTEDVDGCPDRGLVRIESSQLVILDKIYFEPNDAAIPAAAEPILDAVAQTLQGNPQIASVRVEGHAHTSEDRPWSLSAARAAAVRADLIGRGVAAERLQVEPFGATRPIDQRADHNRRAEFFIAENREAQPSGSASAAAQPTAPAPLARQAVVEDASGAVVYRAPAPIDLPAGATALVTVLDHELEGGEVWLYRPSAEAPGTDLHPMRAIALRVPDSLELVRGSVAVYTDGRFAGEGLLQDLDAGERGFVPFRIDRGARVTTEVESAREPRRAVSLRAGVVTIEHTLVRRTRYEVESGPHAPSRIVLVHTTAIGHEFRGELPPASEGGMDAQGRTAQYIPLPIRAGRLATLTLEEVRTQRSRVDLRRDRVTDLRPFLERATGWDDATRTRFERIVAARVELRTLEETLGRHRRRLGDTSARAAELRRNLEALDRNSDEGLRRTLRTRLREATEAGEEVARAIDALGARRVTLEADLAAAWE